MADFSEVYSSLSDTDSSTSSVAFRFLGGGAEVAFRRGDLDFDPAAFHERTPYSKRAPPVWEDGRQ